MVVKLIVEIILESSVALSDDVIYDLGLGNICAKHFCASMISGPPGRLVRV